MSPTASRPALPIAPAAFAFGLLLAAAGAACGVSKSTPPPGGGGVGGSAAVAGSAATACLDRPDELPRPPAGMLPCDLLPPGFSR